MSNFVIQKPDQILPKNMDPDQATLVSIGRQVSLLNFLSVTVSSRLIVAPPT